MGLGDECVKKLQEGLVIIHKNNGVGELDMTELVKDVLIANNRWYVKIGKQALLKEANELNEIALGCEILKSAASASEHHGVPQSMFGIFFNAGGLLQGVNNMLDEAFSELNEMFDGPNDDVLKVVDAVKMRKIPDELKIPEKVKGVNLASLLKNKDYIYSSGAGGFKKFASLKSKFTCYTIEYPKLKFDSKEKVEKFIDEMAKCALIPNSLFCCAGSKKVYLAGKKEMK